MVGSGIKALRDFVLLSGGELIAKLASLLAFAYLARVFSPGAYGSIEVMLALLGIFVLVVDFGFSAIGAREVAHRKEAAGQYARLIPGMKLLLAAASIPLMCGAGLLLASDHQTRLLIFIASFSLLAAAWNQSWLFQGLDRMSLVSLNQVIRMLVFALLTWVFVRGENDLLRVGFIEIAASLTVVAYFICLQYRESIPVSLEWSLPQGRSLAAKAFPVGASNMVWSLNQYLPTLLVSYYLGGAATAWIGAAHRIVNAIISFSLVYHFNLFPSVARRLNHSVEAFNELAIPSFRVTAWGGIGIALTVTVLAEHICVLVFGPQFASAARPMAILSWSLPLTLLNGHARWALIARDKQRFVLYAQSAGTATTVVACLLLIPTFGPAGGAVAMVCCSAAVWLVAHLAAVKQVAPLPSINLVWKPAALAIIWITCARLFAGATPTVPLACVAGFLLMAPLIDPQLPGDIRRFSRIKNDALGD